MGRKDPKNIYLIIPPVHIPRWGSIHDLYKSWINSWRWAWAHTKPAYFVTSGQSCEATTWIPHHWCAVKINADIILKTNMISWAVKKTNLFLSSNMDQRNYVHTLCQQGLTYGPYVCKHNTPSQYHYTNISHRSQRLSRKLANPSNSCLWYLQLQLKGWSPLQDEGE